ncbi:MAG: ParB-like nuclease domain-containing protein [Candidatus Aminicenantes bacterium]|nr:ParB-like nuclease domain-containing protein [Candidatus Aminicenantes bacterium]
MTEVNYNKGAMDKHTLQITDINKADDRFRFCYFPDLSSILSSIKKIGLVYPLVLTERAGKKIIVCGWKRLLACEKLSYSEVPALILNEEDDLKVFNTAVFENAAFRKFNLLEKAEILSKWRSFNVKEITVIRELMPLFDIPPTKEYFDLFHAISGIDNDIKREIAYNRMDLKTLALFIEVDPSSRKTILPMLLSLSQNKQKELLGNLVEITLRENISFDSLINSKNFQTIMNMEHLSVRQRTERLSQYLKEIRFPLLASRLDRFASLSNKTGLKKERIDIKASDYFEGEGMMFSFSVCDVDEYNKKLKALTELTGKKELSELFKLISNEDE